MTTRRHYIIVALLGYLLAFAASASAECAWVLWAQTPTGYWWPAYSVDDPHGKATCDVFKSANVLELPKGTFTVCLPDTVDPRGPKR